jgi:hypothetical protein
MFFPTWVSSEGGIPAVGRPSTNAYRKVEKGLDLEGPEVMEIPAGEFL